MSKGLRSQRITMGSFQMAFEDENFYIYISNLSKAIDRYNPSIYGYEWAMEDYPCFQMEPQGYRGYIEGRPVREL